MIATCPSCRTEYAEDLERCPACGADGEWYTCERCGTEFETADACPGCGLARVEIACDRHPDRTAEGRCVICGTAVCEKCDRGADRRVYLCEEHAGMTVMEGWVQVYSTATEIEGQLLRENLRAEGIDAEIFSQKDRSFNVDLGELSIVRIFVQPWEYRTAMKIIRDHMDTEGEVVFACPSCGEPYEPGDRECSACGAALV